MQNTKACFSGERSVAFEIISMVLLWFTGFAVAYFTYLRSGPFLAALMRRAFRCSVSIVDLVLVGILPIVITVLIGISYKSFFLHLLCFVKSFQFSLCTLAIYAAFGAAGWIAMFLLMFSDCLMMLLLWVTWTQLILKKGCLPIKHFIYSLVYGIVVIVLNAYMIAPMVISFNI